MQRPVSETQSGSFASSMKISMTGPKSSVLTETKPALLAALLADTWLLWLPSCWLETRCCIAKVKISNRARKIKWRKKVFQGWGHHVYKDVLTERKEFVIFLRSLAEQKKVVSLWCVVYSFFYVIESRRQFEPTF